MIKMATWRHRGDTHQGRSRRVFVPELFYAKMAPRWTHRKGFDLLLEGFNLSVSAASNALTEKAREGIHVINIARAAQRTPDPCFTLRSFKRAHRTQPLQQLMSPSIIPRGNYMTQPHWNTFGPLIGSEPRRRNPTLPSQPIPLI